MALSMRWVCCKSCKSARVVRPGPFQSLAIKDQSFKEFGHILNIILKGGFDPGTRDCHPCPH